MEDLWRRPKISKNNKKPISFFYIVSKNIQIMDYFLFYSEDINDTGLMHLSQGLKRLTSLKKVELHFTE